MPFLQLADGETAILEVVSDDAKVVFQHWLKGVAFDCTEDNCPFCAKQVRRSARFLVEVKWAREPFTWGLSKRLYAMLMYLTGGSGSIKGVFVELSRVGVGLDTQWRLNTASGPPPSVLEVAATTPTAEVAAGHDAQVKLIEEIKFIQETLQKAPPDRRLLFEQELAGLKETFVEHFGDLPEGIEEIKF